MAKKSNKRIQYTVLILITAAAVLLPLFFGNCTKRPQPNVVLIVIDTLRADHLPFYGYKKNTAPFMSKLVSEGVLFENAHSASTWTAPATASIHTGMYPYQHGVQVGLMASRKNKIEINRIPDNIQTLAEMLKENGYRTYSTANNINVCREQGFHQGFDRFKMFKYAHEEDMTKQLEDWAEEIKSGDKYFLYIHYNDPHGPYHERKPWYQKPLLTEGDPLNPRRINAARYDSEINYVDEKIRKLYELYGWDENTLVIITSDHGEGFGLEHKHVRGHGHTFFFEELEVPLIINFPPSDRVHKRLGYNTSNIDILPTIRSYLDIQQTQTESGMNLLPLIKGDANGFEDRYLFPYLKTKILRVKKATIHKEWKLMFFPDKPNLNLFNMVEDPLEQKNVYKKNKKLAEKLLSKYLEFEKKCKKFKRQTKKQALSEEKKKELKTLGYVQ